MHNSRNNLSCQAILYVMSDKNGGKRKRRVWAVLATGVAAASGVILGTLHGSAEPKDADEAVDPAPLRVRVRRAAYAFLRGLGFFTASIKPTGSLSAKHFRAGDAECKHDKCSRPETCPCQCHSAQVRQLG